ncbi:MAG: Calx-beta domain-containing protein [bacterium]
MEGRNFRQRGAVLTMTLMFFVVFLVIATAWLGFAVRQSHEVTDQEQEEQAFQVGEAGVERTLFFLNSGVYTPDDLLGLSSPLVGVVQDAAGHIMGSYELTFAGAGGGSVTVTALAHDLEVENRCQRIVADIESMTGALADTTEYYARSWDHDLEVTCGAPGVETALPTIKFNPAWTMMVVEGDPPDVNQVAFTIVLSHVYPLRVTVDFRAEGYSIAATPGEDFVPADQAVVFNPGEVSKTVMVNIVADNVWERWGGWWPIEYLRGVISNPRNGNLAWPTSRNVWIIDDD